MIIAKVPAYDMTVCPKGAHELSFHEYIIECEEKDYHEILKDKEWYKKCKAKCGFCGKEPEPWGKNNE